MTGLEEQLPAFMLRVNGEETSWPLVGLVMIVCASAGIIVPSARQAQKRFRVNFIENSFTEK